jgi:hypothetical protein
MMDANHLRLYLVYLCDAEEELRVVHCAHLAELVLLAVIEKRSGRGRILLATCLPNDNKPSQPKVNNFKEVWEMTVHLP